MMTDREIIENRYRELYRGMVEKNRGLLDEVLDASFVLVHMTGMRQSKAAFIGAVEDGTLQYFSAKHERIDVELHDDRAELIGQSVVNAAVFGGGAHTWRLQLRLKIFKKESAWHITEASASTY